MFEPIRRENVRLHNFHQTGGQAGAQTLSVVIKRWRWGRTVCSKTEMNESSASFSCIAAHPRSHLLLLLVSSAVPDLSLSSLLLSSLSSSALLFPPPPPPLPRLGSLLSAATSVAPLRLRPLTLSWCESALDTFRGGGGVGVHLEQSRVE